MPSAFVLPSRATSPYAVFAPTSVVSQPKELGVEALKALTVSSHDLEVHNCVSHSLSPCLAAYRCDWLALARFGLVLQVDCVPNRDESVTKGQHLVDEVADLVLVIERDRVNAGVYAH